jgi:hypothetical protein
MLWAERMEIMQPMKEIQLKPKLFVSRMWIMLALGAVFHILAINMVANCYGGMNSIFTNF